MAKETVGIRQTFTWQRLIDALEICLVLPRQTTSFINFPFGGLVGMSTSLETLISATGIESSHGIDLPAVPLLHYLILELTIEVNSDIVSGVSVMQLHGMGTHLLEKEWPWLED